MFNSAQKQIAEDFAIHTLCADTGGYTYADLLDALDQGILPDGVSIWQPFEYHEPQMLAEVLENFHDTFTHFATNAVAAG